MIDDHDDGDDDNHPGSQLNEGFGPPYKTSRYHSEELEMTHMGPEHDTTTDETSFIEVSHLDELRNALYKTHVKEDRPTTISAVQNFSRNEYKEPKLDNIKLEVKSGKVRWRLKNRGKWYDLFPKGDLPKGFKDHYKNDLGEPHSGAI